MTAKARAVVEDALSRSESPGASNSSRIALLNQLAFAGQGQIDEAERLANEAVVILERLPPPQAKQYACHLQQIRPMIDQWKSRARAPG